MSRFGPGNGTEALILEEFWKNNRAPGVLRSLFSMCLAFSRRSPAICGSSSPSIGDNVVISHLAEQLGHGSEPYFNLAFESGCYSRQCVLEISSSSW